MCNFDASVHCHEHGWGGIKHSPPVYNQPWEKIRARLRRWSALIIMMVIFLFALGCGPKAKLMEPKKVATPYCLLMIFQYEGDDILTKSCSAQIGLCEQARRQAIFFAPLAHIKAVGECKYEPE